MAYVFCGVKLYSVQMTFSLKLKAVWVVTKYGCQKSGYFMNDPNCIIKTECLPLNVFRCFANY